MVITICRFACRRLSLARQYFLCSRRWLHSNDDKNAREKAREKIAQIDAESSNSPNTPLGVMNRSPRVDPNDVSISPELLAREQHPAYKPFPDNKNPKTGEINGPTGPEPTRYGDWEHKGRCSDF